MAFFIIRLRGERYVMIVRCQKCGFGNRVKDGSTLMICGKCGANPRVSEVKRVGR